MATESNTRVIDPEFAIYGPMGFDLGAFMANLLLAFFAQEGHATDNDNREDYRAWILDTLESFWTLFEEKFLALWSKGGKGDAFLPPLFADDTGEIALEAYRHMTMARLFQDAIGFTGAKMARRILGLAHVEDLESITDPDRRALCEKRALKMARALMVGRASLSTINEIRTIAETIAKESVS